MVWASPPPTAYICFCTSFVCTYPRRENIIETIATTRGPRAMRSGAVFSETVVRPPSAWSNSARAPPARIGRRGESSAGTPLRADAFAGFRRGADSFTVDNTLRPRCQKPANESSRRRKSANAVRAESDDVSGGLTEVFSKPDYSVGYFVDLLCRLIKKVNQICWLTSENSGRVDWIRTSDPLTPRHTQKI